LRKVVVRLLSAGKIRCRPGSQASCSSISDHHLFAVLKQKKPANQAEANRNDADAFAESLRPIVAPFIHLSSRRIAKVLNDRGIKSPTGKA